MPKPKKLFPCRLLVSTEETRIGLATSGIPGYIAFHLDSTFNTDATQLDIAATDFTSHGKCHSLKFADVLERDFDWNYALA